MPPFHPDVPCSFLLAVSIVHHDGDDDGGEGKHREGDFPLIYRFPELGLVKRCWAEARQAGPHPLPAG